MKDGAFGRDIRAGKAPPLLARRQRLIVLAICCTSLFMAGIDTTIVNLALPSIGRGLSVTASGLQWTVASYTLVMASLFISSGAFADRFGRKRAFLAGLWLFAVGSLLCSASPTFPVLIASRVVQAVGASMLNPVAMSIIRNVFTEPRERARAIGVWGSVIGISMAVGPVTGGALVGVWGWRAIFWLNVPVSLAASLLARRFVPESRPADPRPADPGAQVLLLAVLGSMTFALIEGPQQGWSSPASVVPFCGTGLAGLALVWHEVHHKQPLLDLRYFRSAPFTGVCLIAAASYASFGSFLFLNSLYLQQARGFSALQAGIITLPMAAMTILAAPLSGRLVGHLGTRLPLAFGGICMLAGSGLMISIGQATLLVRLLAAYALFGAGFGSVNPPINQTAVSGMPATQVGVAAATASTSRQVGQTLGVALLGVASVAVTSRGLASGVAGWSVPAAFGAGIVLVALITTGRWGMATATHPQYPVTPSAAGKEKGRP